MGITTKILLAVVLAVGSSGCGDDATTGEDVSGPIALDGSCPAGFRCVLGEYQDH